MKRTGMMRLLGAGAVLLALPLLLSAGVDLSEKVRHELVMLPWYGVFDSLSYHVDRGQVTLSGQVVLPTLKSDAENVVKRIPGVTSVVNKIEVLPLSPSDDRIRMAELRAVYSDPSMTRYGMGAQPSIHIVVDNGNVTLEGVVNNETDRNIANIRANQVFGVFSVTNNLRVAG